MSVNFSQYSPDKVADLFTTNSFRVFTDTDIGIHNLFDTLSTKGSFNYSDESLSVNTEISQFVIASNNSAIAQDEIVRLATFDNPSAESFDSLGAGIYDFDDVNLITPNAAINAPSLSTSTPTLSTPNTTTITPLTSDGVRVEAGNLRANTFTYQPGYSLTVVSGNGNVDYGNGGRDILDLSPFVSNTVSFNRLYSSSGGEVYNPGNGNRLFDAMTLSNGNKILFEGIETIKFADTTINLSVTPNDPLFSNQWNLQAMGVHNAWRFTQGSNRVLIGIEDTGLGTNSSGNIHPDLRATTFLGNNYLDESPSFSHGTLVAGAIAAQSNNGIGTAGINSNSSLMLVDVVGDEVGVYNLFNATQAIINQANTQGQRTVINLSLSGGNTPEFEQLVANNQDKALFVIAAGNQDQNSLTSPADLAKKYGNVIAVGASWGTKDWYGNPQNPGERIRYSNWWSSSYGDGLTLMAPSEYVTTSATRTSTNTPYNFDYERYFNGTSAAAPNVTGVASLVWSVNPSLTANDIKSILLQTAFDLGTPGYDQFYGHGFVNADAAVRRAMAFSRGVG